MSDTFVIDVAYEIKYTTKIPVPIYEIIESLENIEKLLKRTPAFLEQKYKTIKIIDVEVFVSKIESGSLIQDFVVKYVFKGKENCEDAKRVFDNIMNDSAVVKTLVAMGVGGMIMYAAMELLPTGSATTHIEAHNNTIINIGASVDFSSDDFKAALNSIKDKKSLVKEVVGATKPAKADPAASIEMSGIEALTIAPETVLQLPEKYEAPAQAEREVKYQNVEMVVYASDRDKSEGGWAGIVPTIVNARTPVILADGIDPAKLHGRIRFMADIVVHERFVTSKKRYEAKKIEIMNTN